MEVMQEVEGSGWYPFLRPGSTLAVETCLTEESTPEEKKRWK
jgi:hypothetical protein